MEISQVQGTSGCNTGRGNRRRSSFVVDSVILECDGTLDKASEPTAGKEGGCKFSYCPALWSTVYIAMVLLLILPPDMERQFHDLHAEKHPVLEKKKGAGISGPVDLHS